MSDKPDWSNVDSSTDIESTRGGTKDGVLKQPLTRGGGDDGDDDRNSSSAANGIGSKIAGLLSLSFGIAFIFLAVYFDNDKSLDDREWVVFLSIQATLALLSVVFQCYCRYFGFCISIFALLAMIWSIIMLVAANRNFQDVHHPDGVGTTNQTNATTESSSWNEFVDNFAHNLAVELGIQSEVDKEQVDYELACAIVGLVSSVYHLFLWCCKCC